MIARVPEIEPLLQRMAAANATDLHLSVGSVPRLRVDGHLTPLPDAAPTTVVELDAILADLLSDADRAVFERDRQVDFSFGWSGEGSGTAQRTPGAVEARFRANAYHQKGRTALALRLIPAAIPTPEQLGLPDATARLVTRPHGLVLMTGPTGSGKSTTLAAMIGWINRNRPVHVLTIEDPVEYVHESEVALVNQREVGSDATNFPEALRSALREDPDVVLVGEMRDLETISLALTLAETGHLVFGTVHTNDAAQTVDRIVDAYPSGQQPQVRTQFSMTLAAVISQRLVPRIGGGRVAAFELMMGTAAVTNLIREGQVRQLRNAIATGARDGMMVLEASLNHLISHGVISYEAAVAASVYPDEILRPAAAVDPSTGQPVATDPLTGQPLGGPAA